MENNILLLAEKDLHQLTQLNLQPYDDILLLTASPDHSVPISTIRQLLGLQQQFQRQINLLTSSVSKPNQTFLWAWLLGKISVRYPEKNITILDNSPTLQQLAAICNEQGQSIQLLNAPAIVNTAKESTEELQPQDKNPVLDQPELTPIAEQVSESTELPAATTITVKKSEYQLQPANAESKDPVAIASMIIENEERRRKNNQIIVDRHRGRQLAAPLPHHLACGSAPGGSRS
ncbi:MAG: hypothetical protein KAZ06_03450 [Tolumonas sp.]|nr:hypothetical protein [Tolumonas sp.]